MNNLDLVKLRVGIKSNARDEYLKSIIEGVKTELKDIQGIEIDESNEAQQMFLVDYVAYRYLNRDEATAMPRHLQFRLHNLFVEKRKTK